MRNNIDLAPIFRDRGLLEDIRSEVKRQALTQWIPWEVKLPPTLLWPMIKEVSEGMMEWSPTLDGIGVQVGEPNEVAIRFVLKGLKTSPVKVQALKYKTPSWLEEVEVRHGAAV